MLAGGSEMYRVEDTMRRIAVNAGIKEVNVFAMPTGLFVSLDDEETSSVTELEAVKKRSINLELVDRVNELSREFADKRIDLCQLEEKLTEVEEDTPSFPFWLQVIGAGILSATLMVLFLDVYDWVDFPVAGLIGASGYWMDAWLKRHTKVRFWLNSSRPWRWAWWLSWSAGWCQPATSIIF